MRDSPSSSANASGTATPTGPPALERSNDDDSESHQSGSGTDSEPSTPTSAHHSVVPAYPYNVVPVPQHYGPTPDDSGINARLPSICVDYLSHDWAEEDTWASWKAMTRHKSEIANGVRLENASWRTWAKQRGNLKTISPETLNWLKDSDVTWLYGPLHTAVDAVPPPKAQTASDRLGLEPLRSLSDSKTVSKGAEKEKKKEEPVVPQKAEPKPTKPILKYRSLSDILLPPGTPGSPSGEELEHDFDGSSSTISVHHARSDSHLVRLNSINRKRRSPVHSPRDQSPDHTSDSSSNSNENSTLTRRTSHKRHISFNHRVEQCIAVDSTEDNSRYKQLGRGSISIHGASSSDEEGDDEDDVLTFKSSPRVANFGHQPLQLNEPHTIARLGPTTLKSVELYPAPSPAVYYPDSPEHKTKSLPPTNAAGPSTGPAYGQQVPNYSRGTQPGGRRRVMYDYSGSQPSGQDDWDGVEDDDDYGMGGFNEYYGPDVGVGDSYDPASYGSQHLIGGHHNDFQPGSAGFGGNGPSYNPAGVNSGYPTPPTVSVNSAAERGPHSPAGKDAQPAKRSILKGNNNNLGRSRENSSASDDGTPVDRNGIPISGRFGGPSPPSPAGSSPGSLGSSPQSPYTPSPSLSGVVATAIPQHVRPGMRRQGSSDGNETFGRGRSASRGSSSSLERAASADRRSTSSVSPSSYSPPSPVVGSPAGRIGNGGLIGTRRSSYDRLDTLGAPASAGARLLPDLIEGSSESEAETVREQRQTSSSSSDEEDEPASASLRSRQLSSGSSDNAMIEEVGLSDSLAELVKGQDVPATITDDERLVSSPDLAKGSQSDSPFASSATTSQSSDQEAEGEMTPMTTPTLASAAKTAPLASPAATKQAETNAEQVVQPVAASFDKKANDSQEKEKYELKKAAAAAESSAPASSPPIHAPTARTPGAPKFRQPSPSGATTSTSTAIDGTDDGSSTAVPSPAQLRSLSSSPALDPAELAAAKWSDDLPAQSNASSARNSLLKAARRTSSSSHDLQPSTSRASTDSHRKVSGSSSTAGDDDGFGYFDGEQETGLVGRTLEVSRDLLGALGKGLWGLGKK